MNLAEKLAATYLRLNGFFLLPHFTVFDGDNHNHVDIAGVRIKGSKESVGQFVFPTDAAFLDAITNLLNASPPMVAIAAEVRTNVHRDFPNDAHMAYLKRFVGPVPIVRLAFYQGSHTVAINGQTLDIGLRYAGIWIQKRIDTMEETLRLTKTGSWNLSEPFLADFLALRACGLLTVAR